MVFVIQVLIFCLIIALSDASEWCDVNGESQLCSNYCCKFYFQNYCCNTCSDSIYSHPECNNYYTSRRYYTTTSYSYTYSSGSIIGVIFSFIFFIIIAVLIVCCCCGCICSARTGIQRKGKVVNQPTSSITVISQNQTTYPPVAYNNPQNINACPPVAYYNPQIINTNPPVQSVANQQITSNTCPPFPANQQLYPPNYQVHNNNIMPPAYQP